MVWSHFPIIRQTKEGLGRQHQGMDRALAWKVPEGNGGHSKFLENRYWTRRTYRPKMEVLIKTNKQTEFILHQAESMRDYGSVPVSGHGWPNIIAAECASLLMLLWSHVHVISCHLDLMYLCAPVPVTRCHCDLRSCIPQVLMTSSACTLLPRRPDVIGDSCHYVLLSRWPPVIGITWFCPLISW